MKKILYNILIVLCSLQFASAQECHDGLLNYLNSTEINKLHVGTSFDLEGSTIEQKGESFILTMSTVLSQRLGVNVEYVSRVLTTNSSTYLIYDQYIDGVLVEGSSLILGFDNNGDLSSFNHLGSTSIDDLGIIRDNSEIINNKLSSKGDSRLLRSSSTNVPGYIHIDFPNHSYNYACPQGLSGLTEIAVGGASGAMTSSRLTMVATNSNQTFWIADCENSVISVQPGSSFQHDEDNYLVCPEDFDGEFKGRFEYAMCYYNLTELSEYFEASPCNGEVGDLGTVLFDPYVLGQATTYILTSVAGAGNTVQFGALDPSDPANGYHDLAEDAQIIIEGGLHYWYKYNSNFIMPNDDNSSDGVVYGYLDYITHSYSIDKFDYTSTNLMSWGENGSNQRSVSVASNANYPSYLDNFGAGEFQKRGQLLGAALYEISQHDLLSKDIADELAFKSMSLLNSTSTQIEAAMAIIQKAHDIGLAKYQICAIETILANRYPNSIVSSEMFDFYIQDEVWDTGEEGSEDARHYVSPDIWNRLEVGPIYEHENPEHNDDADNFLYIRLRDRECGIPDGKLKVYFSESSTSHAWPTDWENTAPTLNNYTYFIGELDLNSFIDTWEDGITDEDVFLYEFPWVPYDPTDFGFPDGVHVHGCLLVRIDSPIDDPMFNEVDGSNVKHNIKVNNNIGSINTTVIHVSSSDFVPPNPERHRLLIRHYALNGSANQTGSVNDQIVIETIPSVGNTANSILDYGNIEIELSPPLLQAWQKGGTVGRGIKFLPPNKIVVTEPNATMSNVLIDLIKKYPINVSFNQKRPLDFEIEFHINLETENGCNIGGEKYIIRPIERIGKGEKEEKDDTAEELKRRSSINDSRIYPNPATNFLDVNISEEINSFEITDGSGKRIRDLEFSKIANNIRIDLSGFNTGVYYINIQLANGTSEVHKFVKI